MGQSTRAPGRTFTWVAIVLSAGCNDGSTASARAPEASVSRSELPGALAAAVCDNVSQCCSTSGKSFDYGACRRGVSDEAQSLLDRETGSRTFDAREAAACVNSVAAAARQCDMAKVNLGAMSCAHPHGKLGEPCGATCFERGAGFACDFPSAPPSAGDAGPRNYSVDCYVNDSLYCGTDGTCANQVDPGAACDSNDACRSEWCERGACQAPVTEGGSCAEHVCASHLYCDSFSIICHSLRADGAPCGAPEQCESGYCNQPGSGGGAVAIAGDAAPPPDRGTCAPPTPSSTDPQYLAFACGQ